MERDAGGGEGAAGAGGEEGGFPVERDVAHGGKLGGDFGEAGVAGAGGDAHEFELAGVGAEDREGVVADGAGGPEQDDAFGARGSGGGHQSRLKIT